jgi:hypothetical protein
MKKKLYMLVALLFVFVPLGLLTNSPAWGEWENEHYQKLLGYIPSGIANAKSLDAPIPDYAIGGTSQTLSYYLSALLGIVLLFGIYYFLLKVLKK